jgi:hypothetical protein
MVRSLPDILRTSLLIRSSGVKVTQIHPPNGELFTNPTLTALDDGSLAIAVREVSYFVDRRGRYVKLVDPPTSRTWLGSFDAVSLRSSGLEPLAEQTPDSWVLEDPRLFETPAGLGGLWAVRDYTTGRYEVKMAVGEITDSRIKNVRIIESPHQANLEKNWMPFIDGGELNFIYRADSAERYTFRNDLLHFHSAREDRWDELRGQSGSSQLIPWKSGWLCVTHAHTVLSLPFRIAAWRFYRHYFVYFSPDFSTVTVSNPFNFLRRGIEFCSGLAVTPEGIFIGFGARDRTAHVACVDETLVERALKQGRTTN